MSGSAKVGQTLTAEVMPSGASVDYKWQNTSTQGSGYSDIEGADGSTYEIQDSDVDKYIICKVTGKDKYSGEKTSKETAKVTAQ